MDWLIGNHFLFNMQIKTLFACIYIIDAFLSKKFIEIKYFQLLGMAALLIACKLFEIRFPPIHIFLKLSAFAYTAKQLKEMEREVMLELNFDILTSTADEFFAINSEYFKFNKEQTFLGEYFLHISLMDYDMLKYKPSTIAVVCGCLVMKHFNLSGIPLILENTSKDVSHEEVKKLC